jgi:hypothetical protein
MKSLLILSVLVALSTSCSTEARFFEIDQDKIGVRYRGAKGTIFISKEFLQIYFTSLGIDSAEMWIPTRRDIARAENILRKEIKRTKESYPRSYGPRVHSHLAAYFRQYVCYMNASFERVININGNWNRISLRNLMSHDRRLDFSSEYHIVFDGGSYHWSADINLDKMEMTRFGTNGIARKMKKEILGWADLIRPVSLPPQERRRLHTSAKRSFRQQ